MTPEAMLRHMIERPARVEDERNELEERTEGDDMLEAALAWHAARSALCKDDKQLADTERDLLDVCRWFFGH